MADMDGGENGAFGVVEVHLNVVQPVRVDHVPGETQLGVLRLEPVLEVVAADGVVVGAEVRREAAIANSASS